MGFLPFSASAAQGPQMVATLGPASLHLAPQLAQAGATGFRLNASHLSPAQLHDAVAQVRAACPDAPVVVDLQGGKMRLGPNVALRTLQAGERIRLSLRADDPLALHVPHAELFRALRPGHQLQLDDGRVVLRVRAADLDGAETQVEVPGEVRPRKGVNLTDHPVLLDDLTPADAERVQAALQAGPVDFALSFLATGAEADWLRRRVPPGTQLIGKIERREAIERLDDVARAVDVLWVCRGDLGVQLGLGEMARWVAGLKPETLSVPVVMAGQVLEHLTHHAEPTRSEACHVLDLMQRGYAGLVLSDETAVGVDPVGAVQWARRLLGAVSVAEN
jgi:pyruvate kinase